KLYGQATVLAEELFGCGHHLGADAAALPRRIHGQQAQIPALLASQLDVDNSGKLPSDLSQKESSFDKQIANALLVYAVAFEEGSFDVERFVDQGHDRRYVRGVCLPDLHEQQSANTIGLESESQRPGNEVLILF